MYNLEQLRMLVVSSELGSFSACARKLGKVQSAISQGIANLEIDLNIKLFDRSTRKPKLTGDGKRVYAYAKAILQQSIELEKAIFSINKQEEAIIKLAVDDALFTPKLIDVIEGLSDRYPQTQLELILVASTDIAEYVESGQADVGIMFSDLILIKNIDLCFIGNQSFLAVAHPNSELSELERIGIADFIPHKQILLRGNNGKELSYFPAIAAQVWWANSFSAILELVKKGIGWAYLPSHMSTTAVLNNELVILPVKFDHKAWNLPVDLITVKETAMGPVLRWFFEELKTILD